MSVVVDLPQVTARERIRRNVKMLLVARGLTYDDVARSLNIRRDLVAQRMSKGKRGSNWTLDEVETLARLLGVKIDLLYAEHLTIEVAASSRASNASIEQFQFLTSAAA